MKTIEFNVEGMTCGHCVRTVKGALAALGAEGSADLNTGKAIASFDESQLSFAQIAAAIEEEGYQVRT